jgi:CRP-like cAMP-binding protein
MNVSSLRPIELGELLQRFGDQTATLLFPVSGMVSLTVPTPEGGNVEVALVGREGVVGVNRILGSAPDLQAIMQVEGDAISTPIQAIEPELQDALRRAVDSYAGGLLIELAQTAACNRLHSVEERTARWLLHAADRAETADLNLTHEFMAMMLGVRRASVTLVLQPIQEAGLIRGTRGVITVLDRRGLEVAACECYRKVRDEYDRLLG